RTGRSGAGSRNRSESCGMTLARLLLAWLPVTVLFVLAWPLDPRFASERPPRRPTRRGADVMLRAIEAAALTLFAALWFDSLGHGGWWLLFKIGRAHV